MDGWDVGKTTNSKINGRRWADGPTLLRQKHSIPFLVFSLAQIMLFFSISLLKSSGGRGGIIISRVINVPNSSSSSSYSANWLSPTANCLPTKGQATNVEQFAQSVHVLWSQAIEICMEKILPCLMGDGQVNDEPLNITRMHWWTIWIKDIQKERGMEDSGMAHLHARNVIKKFTL